MKPSGKARPDLVAMLNKWQQDHGEDDPVCVEGALEAHTSTAAAPRWGKHALARLLHIFMAPSTKALALSMLAAPSRHELDSKNTPWAVFWCKATGLFNDETWVIQTRLAHDRRFEGIDPNHASVFGIGEEVMKTHFRTFKTEFMKAFSNWSTSGQNQNDNFESFCGGNRMLLHGFLVIERDLTNLSALHCRA